MEPNIRRGTFILEPVLIVLHYRRIALHDLNARLGKKQEPLEEWPTLFDEEGCDSRSPNPAVAPPHPPSTVPGQMETKAVEQSTDSLPNV